MIRKKEDKQRQTERKRQYGKQRGMYPPRRHSRDVLGKVDETTLSEHSCPKLHPDDAEDEEHEETQQQDVP